MSLCISLQSLIANEEIYQEVHYVACKLFLALGKAGFGLGNLFLFSSSKNSEAREIGLCPRESFPRSFENPPSHNIIEITTVFNIPAFVMDLYGLYAKHDATVKRNLKRIPPQ